MRKLLLFSIIIAFSVFNKFIYAQNTLRLDTITNNILQAVSVSNDANNKSKHSMDSSQIRFWNASTLGEMLGHQVGIQNEYYGSNAGMPMIRSMSGNRVRILQNGISLNDMSGISPNLNLAVDPATLESVDIYTTNASVLFGGKAIGGAIDLQANVLPKRYQDTSYHGFITMNGSTNNGFQQVFQLAKANGQNMSWLIGGSHNKVDNIRIPGNTKASIAYDPSIDPVMQSMAQVKVDIENIQNVSVYPYISQFVLDHLNDPSYDLSDADKYTFDPYSYIGGTQVANLQNTEFIAGQDPNTPRYNKVVKGIYDYGPVKKGWMTNSHALQNNYYGGIRFWKSKLNTGIYYQGNHSNYGIPGYAQDTSYRFYAPINTKSTSNRVGIESNYQLGTKGGNEIRLSYAFQQTKDQEWVGASMMNAFKSKKHALRLILVDKIIDNWKTKYGLDWENTKLIGSGPLRYMPNTRSDNLGLFNWQDITWKFLRIGLGYRHDWINERTYKDVGYTTGRGLAGGKLAPRGFNLDQYGGEIILPFMRYFYLRGAFNHGERAPAINELYTGNDHFAMMIEENGDDRLKKEIAITREIELGYQSNGIKISGTLYGTGFTNYLYLAHTGISRSGGFLVKEWRGSNTRITGIESLVSYDKVGRANQNFHIQIFYDLVKNKNVSDDPMRQWAEGDYMPNMPTSRYGMYTSFQSKLWKFETSLEHYLKQKYLGKNINPEPPMPSYSQWMAKLNYQIIICHKNATVYCVGNNLLNQEIRSQNSPLKYVAPQPGRNISVGMQLFFD